MLRRRFDPGLPHRYVRYGRMSDPRQNPRSPDQQFHTIDQTVRQQRRSWIHVRDYRDNGVSGRLLRKRLGYQAMLRDIRTGAVQVDLILVDTAERFGRVEEMTEIRRDLYNRYGVLVLTADSLFADPTTIQGKALAMVETMRSTEDGRIKAGNVLRGKRDIAQLKYWPGGPAPFGKKLESVVIEHHGRQKTDNTVLVDDPESSWIIQQLFARAAETGHGATRLARAFNADPAIPEKFKPFYPSTIDFWLSNPIYYGELVWEKHATGIIDDVRVVEQNPEIEHVHVPDFCSELVSRELWDKVAELRAMRSQAYAKPKQDDPDLSEKQIAPVTRGLTLVYLLTGLVRCGECGHSMRPSPSGRKSKTGKTYIYYTCPSAIAGACDNGLYVPEPWIRETVLEQVRARLFGISPLV